MTFESAKRKGYPSVPHPLLEGNTVPTPSLGEGPNHFIRRHFLLVIQDIVWRYVLQSIGSPQKVQRNHRSDILSEDNDSSISCRKRCKSIIVFRENTGIPNTHTHECNPRKQKSPFLREGGLDVTKEKRLVRI